MSRTRKDRPWKVIRHQLPPDAHGCYVAGGSWEGIRNNHVKPRRRSERARVRDWLKTWAGDDLEPTEQDRNTAKWDYW